MAASTRQKLQEDFLTCVVCHEVFTDPVTLHCGHTLCSQCVTAFLKTQAQAIASSVIPCPSCRGLTKVPEPQKPVEEWVGQIKTGFFVKSLVETLSSAPEEDERLCSVCMENGKHKTASSYCLDCRKDYCVECDKCHKVMLKNHRTHASSEAVARKGKTTTKICPDHDQCPIDMMCEDCDKVLCQKCCIVYHRKCESVITLEQALTKIDALMEKQLDVLDKDISKLKTGLDLTKTKIEMLEESAEKAEKDLDSACEKIISKVVEKQKKMKERIASVRESGVEDLKADVKGEEMKLEDAQQKQGLIRQALMSEVHMDHYEMYRICKPDTVEYQQVEKQEKRRVKQIEFSQQETRKLMRGLEDTGVGDLKVTKDVEQKDVPEKRNLPSSDDVSCQEQDISKRNYKLLNTLDPGLRYVCGVVVLNAGDTKVTLCAGYKYVKAFYEENGKPQHSCLFYDQGPISLCKVSASKAAALLDSGDECETTGKELAIMEVTPSLVECKRVVLPRKYTQIAGKNTMTIAAAYRDGNDYGSSTDYGIDTIDLSGRITQTIRVDDAISSLVVTPEGNTMFSTHDSLYCVNGQGVELFRKKCDAKEQQHYNRYASLCLWGENNKAVCVLDRFYVYRKERYSSSYNWVKSSCTLLSTCGEKINLIEYSDGKNEDGPMATDSDEHIYVYKSGKLSVFGF